MENDAVIEVHEPLTESIKTVYRTKDLNQAAFLWCLKGVRLLRLDGSSKPGSTLFFVLELPMVEEDVGKLIISYTNQETRIEPMQMVANQNKLRDLLHCALQKKLRRKDQDNEFNDS